MPDACTIMSLLNERAFQTWGNILMGASVVAGLFLVIMLMVEEVVGVGMHPSRAVVTMTVAAFVGYLGTAWIIRRGHVEETDSGEEPWGS